MRRVNFADAGAFFARVTSDVFFDDANFRFDFFAIFAKISPTSFQVGFFDASRTFLAIGVVHDLELPHDVVRFEEEACETYTE